MVRRQLAAELAAHEHGRVPRELRRRQVLAEAYDLFVERGYPGASMDELSRRVGVTKPVIYDLVGSKEHLFREVMKGIEEELATCVASAVAEQPDLAGRLHAGILAFLRFVHGRRQGWAALRSMESGSGEIATLQREQAARVAVLIASDVELEPREIEVVAHAIDGAVETAALWWQNHPDLTAERLAELLATLLSRGLLSFSKASSRRSP